MLPLTEELRIVNGTARDRTEVVMVFMLDELANEPDEPHSAIYHLKDMVATRLNRYAFNIVSTDFAPDGTIFAIGEWGEVRIFLDGAETEESYDPTRGPMRCVKVIGSDVFACGTALQVFRRRGGDWDDMSPDAETRAEFVAGNLEAIDGFSETEIYAAGAAGVIWWYDGQDWTPVQCPTNATFHAVTCAEDDRVYLCGQGGVLAVGRTDSFELIDHGRRVNDLWGIAHFDGDVYLAGFQAMLTYDGDALDVVGDAMFMSKFFYDLNVCDGVMWSFGMKTVLRFDGEGWDRITDVDVV